MLSLRVLTDPDRDWPLWREVRLAAPAEAPYAFKARFADWGRGGEKRWRARLEQPDAYNVVSLLDGRGVGVASGLPGEDDGGRTWELRSVWVGPEARGHGVADWLLAAVERQTRQAGATELRLAVIPGNDAAVALYRRHGFVATGERGDVLPDGVTRSG